VTVRGFDAAAGASTQLAAASTAVTAQRRLTIAITPPRSGPYRRRQTRGCRSDGQSWFPHAERLSVPHAGHLLMVQNPKALAQGLHDFISRHPTGDVGELPPRFETTHESGNTR
jgi:pimeloyl-ACP methyl ester carboxylesterase